MGMGEGKPIVFKRRHVTLGGMTREHFQRKKREITESFLTIQQRI
jgi:hypothetical protein